MQSIQDKECRTVWIPPMVSVPSIDCAIIGKLNEYLDRYVHEGYSPIRIKCRFHAMRGIEFIRVLSRTNYFFFDYELHEYLIDLNIWLRKLDILLHYYQHFPIYDNKRRPNIKQVRDVEEDISFLNHLCPIFAGSRK